MEFTFVATQLNARENSTVLCSVSANVISFATFRVYLQN